MKFIVQPSSIAGSVSIPGSKSHTIRALVFGLLGDGESIIRSPLTSSDTLSCVSMIEQMGAQVTLGGDAWRVRGTGPVPVIPEDIINTGNSGTSLYIGMGAASLVPGITVFTGDAQIRSRPADGLLASVNDLGGRARSTRGNGKPPIVIEGPVRGGSTSIEAVTSQYLTALLIALPCAGGDSTIRVPLLYEKPYVTMTLGWLDQLGIDYSTDENYGEFRVAGRQTYRPFDRHIPADFSSAAFFLAAAAVTGCELLLEGLDYTDTQGDREVVKILESMGARVEIHERSITIRGGALRGGVFDLNAIPDSLPALSVAACFAEGETRLVNVPQARLKETDRISVMRAELAKMGADIDELPDGLVIRGAPLKGAPVQGHGDHRVVMALAVAALGAAGSTTIATAEAVAVTFPDFMELMRSIGAKISVMEE